MSQGMEREDWDPMTEAYLNEQFNTYQHGARANLSPGMQPCFSRRPVLEKPPCKLYVHGIPPTITDEAFKNIFQKFGMVLSTYLGEAGRCGNKWGLVEYQHTSEGQHAIYSLNGKKPLCLAVQFAMSSEEKLRRKKEREEEKFNASVTSASEPPFSLTDLEPPYPRAHGRGRGMPISPRANVSDIFRSGPKHSIAHLRPHVVQSEYDHIIEEEDAVTYNEPGMYNPYRGGLWDPHNAYMMDNVSLTVSSSQRGRRISMGRSTLLPRERTQVSPRSFAYDLKHAEIDDSGFHIGKCSWCNDPSTLTCEVCGTWYCCPECQGEDWPRHKNLCLLFHHALKPGDASDAVRAETRSKVQERVDKGSSSPRKKAEQKSEGKFQGQKPPDKSKESSQCEERGGWTEREDGAWGGARSPMRDSVGPSMRRGNRRDDEEKTRQEDDGGRGARVGGRGRVWVGDRGRNGKRVGQGDERQPMEGGDGQRRGSCWGGRGRGGKGQQPTEGKQGWTKGPKDSSSPQHTKKRSDDSDEDDWDSSKPVAAITNCETLVDETKNRLENLSISDPIEAANQPIKRLALHGVNVHVCPEQVELPVGKFIQVCVSTTLSAPDTYWITCIENQKDEVAIFEALRKDFAKPLDGTFAPCVGSLCVAVFERSPYRAKVLNVKNSKAEVFFVDYGNNCTCDVSELRQIPQDALKYKCQAVQITMAPGTSDEFLNLPAEKKLAVRAIQKHHKGIVTVEPKCERNESKHFSASTGSEALQRADGKGKPRGIQWPPSIVDLLQEGVAAVCEVQNIIEDDQSEKSAVVGVIFDDAREHLLAVCTVLPSACEKMTIDPSFRPVSGELVAVRDETEEWKRGVVIGKDFNKWKIVFCDQGVVAREKNVQRIPEGFQEVPCLSTACHILSSFGPKSDLFSEKMVVRAKLHLSVLSKSVKDGHVEVICNAVKDDVPICSVKLSAWRPESWDLPSEPPETNPGKPDSLPRSVLLKNEAEVELVHFFNLSAMYIQPCDSKSKEEIKKILLDVSEVCRPYGGRQPLRKVPLKGSLVACKFSTDGNFYRALVTDPRSHDEICVSYIDFGNPDVVKLDDMCALPYSLKQVPAYAVRIALKDTFGSQLNKEATTFLSELVLKNEVLKLVCPDGNFHRCDLLMKNKMSVNEKVKEKMEASWKKSAAKPINRLSAEKVFELTDLEEDSLPVPSDSGRENYVPIQLVTLSTPGKSAVVVCRKDHPLLQVVYIEFQQKINDYCQKCPKTPYVPRPKEMCLAKFSGDEQWYRAHSVASQKGGCVIYFVDFGNWEVVKHSDIRKMAPEFMELPLLAVMCYYKGFTDETISIEAENRLKELIQPMREYTARLWKQDNNRDPVVDIPEITEKLITEKHLSESLFKN